MAYDSNAEQNRQEKVTVSAPANPDKPASTSGGGGGGFTFDKDKIDGIIKKWTDLQVELKKDFRDANLMANVKAPGKEFASGDWEKLANPSGKAFLEQNQKMQDYVQNYIDQLTAAKQKIATNEAETQASLNKHKAL
ncbi:hypothetical protein [Amycolatopsis regifaucium]|uniref:PE domain-containing protein n=1 Tax=Amycolatopsis regifaucium TaxID=546365 RepID=A0A154MM69_9PSEU|nr:hypothetical protein [Amycolatopsis regifaucium]KZB84947.1 hypothetical protein AVL48_01700 [Amycolatopsis regifaucium]OKA03965.1 hypothetical protein ATP06_0232555 [Amycolatopsis regifaucium]SFH99329.1 hypothetical protein SAMN04489731_107353 [Amycolatopsis regifaucium]